VKAVLVKEPQNLDVVNLPEPSPGPGEVLVRVRAAGICGSDMHIYHGTNPLAEYPRVIGHEFAGEIAALGQGVEGGALSVGDHVAADPVTSCGNCYPCSIGRYNVCANLSVFGVHRDGGMAEFVVMPAANVHVVPKDWPWEKVVMTEPFSIAANVLSRTECSARDQVLVMGAGPIGLTVLMSAVLLGARVAVADVLDSRLEFARSLGAEQVFSSRTQNIEEEALKWSEGGVPLIVDAVCVPEIFPSLLRMAAPAGRIAHLSFAERPAAMSSLEITKKELSIIGSRLNCGMFPKVIEWFGQGLDPKKLISHTFPFTRVRDAFSLIEEGVPINEEKPVMEPVMESLMKSVMEEKPIDVRKVILTFQDS
jgi:L-gulonate 5-dehydrogenase